MVSGNDENHPLNSPQISIFMVAINHPQLVKNMRTTLQANALPSYKWVIIPLTIDITRINHSYNVRPPSYKLV